MQQLSNFGSTTLSITMLDTDTAGILTDGSVMPSSGNFIVLIENEYIVVTAISGGNITMTRGYAGTTAVTHSSGTAVTLVLSKEALENFFGERIQVGGYASRPATARSGWIYYANDINLAWQYDGGNWNLYHPLYVPYANRVDLSGWTGVNLSTSTWTDTNGVLTVGNISGNGGENVRFYHKNVPSAPYKLNVILQTPTLAAQYSGGGIGFYNTTSGKLKIMANVNNNIMQSISLDSFNSTTSFAATQARLQHWGSPFWMQIEDDNTNWTYRISFDGVHYLQIYQETRNTFFTPDKVCIAANRVDNTVTGDEYFQFLGYWEQ